ncbi:MAG: esterase [Actinobacteria bacterium]|nr:esterase [Actinomycetota bacterium]
MDDLLRVDIVGGPAVAILSVVAGALFLYLLIRRPTLRWLVTSVGALLTGLLLAVLIWFIVIRINHAFGIPIKHVVYFWFAGTLAGVCLAIANMWRSRWWRKVIAACAVLVFIAVGSLGINAAIGLDRTLGSLLGIVARNPITLPPPTAKPHGGPQAPPLWKTWKPPADMPTHGTVGTQIIPNAISGFASRPAGIYLPPAALVPNAPRLPLVVLMMGQPGSPDPSYVAGVLDQFAARHDGLAPIVVVADQIGDPNQDPLCLDTAKFGKAKTFIVQDVVNWAVANLNVIKDPRYRTIAGYSNGGACAMSYLAEYPNLWSNVLDISGEEYPGSEQPSTVLADIFHGDQAAYDAIKPENLLAARKIPGTFGVFTVGSNDLGYIPGVQRIAAAASAAGMSAVYYEVPNGGHVLPALTDGLAKGFSLLYPRLGLSEAAA